MIYPFILSLLVSLSGGTSNLTTLKAQVRFCEFSEGNIKVSDLKNCMQVTLLINPDAGEEYKDAALAGYSLGVFQVGQELFSEEVQGNTLSDLALERIYEARPGEKIVIGDVRIQTKNGIRGANGILYTVIAD